MINIFEKILINSLSVNEGVVLRVLGRGPV